MPRTSRKQVFKCQDHMLTLKPLKHNLYFSETISCCFCNEKKHTNKPHNGKKEQDNCLTCPIFNMDCNHGSPAFILSSQRVRFKSIKSYFSQNGQRLQLQHNKKIQHYTDSKSELCIPKPRSKHNYCSVCRRNYDDYLEHILSSKHKKEISHSKFNNYILEVAKKFKTNQPNEHVISSNQTLSDQDVQIIQGPRKRIKPNPQLESIPIHQFPVNQPRMPFYNAPMPMMPSMFMPHISYDMNLMFQRQMRNMGSAYYYFPQPLYMNPHLQSFSYPFMPGHISFDPLRANYVNQ